MPSSLAVVQPPRKRQSGLRFFDFSLTHSNESPILWLVENCIPKSCGGSFRACRIFISGDETGRTAGFGFCVSWSRAALLPLSASAPPEKQSEVAHFWCTRKSLRINTCKSVSKQSTLTPFRINTYEKRGEGEELLDFLSPRHRTRHAVTLSPPPSTSCAYLRILAHTSRRRGGVYTRVEVSSASTAAQTQPGHAGACPLHNSGQLRVSYALAPLEKLPTASASVLYTSKTVRSLVICRTS